MSNEDASISLQSLIVPPVDEPMDEAEELRARIMTRAYELRALLDEISKSMSDEEVAQGAGTDMLPLWNPGESYSAGDRCRWDEVAYEVLQSHTSQADWQPPLVPALYRRIVVEGIPEWVQPTGAHDAYNIGDKVRHDGHVWQSLIDGNVWEPTLAVSNLWQQIDNEEEA